MIYFIESEIGPIKIGYTGAKINARVSSIQSSSPCLIMLLHSVDGCGNAEKAIHARFSHLRLHGEWFKQAPELLDFIDTVKETGTIPLDYKPRADYKPRKPIGPGQKTCYAMTRENDRARIRRVIIDIERVGEPFTINMAHIVAKASFGHSTDVTAFSDEDAHYFRLTGEGRRKYGLLWHIDGPIQY